MRRSRGRKQANRVAHVPSLPLWNSLYPNANPCENTADSRASHPGGCGCGRRTGCDRRLPRDTASISVDGAAAMSRACCTSELCMDCQADIRRLASRVLHTEMPGEHTGRSRASRSRRPARDDNGWQADKRSPGRARRAQSRTQDHARVSQPRGVRGPEQSARSRSRVA